MILLFFIMKIWDQHRVSVDQGGPPYFPVLCHVIINHT